MPKREQSDLPRSGCAAFHISKRSLQYEVMSLAEACAIARIGRTTLYKAIRRNELRVIKVGRRTLVHRFDLHEWLRSAPAIRARVRAPAAQMRSQLRAKVQGPP
jgi:excisionase family DNA binding protein